MKWIELQSRIMLKAFNRNYDILSASAQKFLNWSVLGIDVGFVIFLLYLL